METVSPLQGPAIFWPRSLRPGRPAEGAASAVSPPGRADLEGGGEGEDSVYRLYYDFKSGEASQGYQTMAINRGWRAGKVSVELDLGLLG